MKIIFGIAFLVQHFYIYTTFLRDDTIILIMTQEEE